MSDRPLLAVHVGRTVPALLPRLLASAGPQWTPVAADPGLNSDATVQGHLFAAEVLPRRPPPSSAVWLTAGDDDPVLAEDAPHPVIRVLELPRTTGTVATADIGVSDVVLPAAARPVLPFARSRWRELRGLPSSMTAVIDGHQRTAEWGSDAESTREHRTPSGHVPTLLALTASAVVTGPTVIDALAWACPVVTDPRTADTWGLTAGEHVLVDADAGRRRELAGQLARDQSAAAALGRAGWAAVTARTMPAAAEALARRLGFAVEQTAPPSNGLTVAMDELGTPATAFIRRRVHDHVAALPGAVTHAWLPTTEEKQ
jgi:hypothetical protein